MDERKISGRLDETKMFGENTSNIRRQMETPIQVIIGNPPYEDGKDSANEETGKTSYPNLEMRVKDTYISRNEGKKNLDRHSYNSFFLAFRWASDRIIENENGGIIGFISNGAWIENNPGFRQTLINEFSKIYVLNLRGKQTTRGEESKREGGKNIWFRESLTNSHYILGSLPKPKRRRQDRLAIILIQNRRKNVFPNSLMLMAWSGKQSFHQSKVTG